MNDNDTVIQFPHEDPEIIKQFELSEQFKQIILTEVVDLTDVDHSYALSAFCAEFITLFAHDTGISKQQFLDIMESMYDEASIIVESNS